MRRAEKHVKEALLTARPLGAVHIHVSHKAGYETSPEVTHVEIIVDNPKSPQKVNFSSVRTRCRYFPGRRRSLLVCRVYHRSR